MAGFPARCRTLGDQGQAPPLVAPAFPAHCGSPSVEGSSLHWLHVSQTCGHPAQNTMGHGSLKTLVLRFGHCRCVDQPVGCCGQQGRYHNLISSWCWPNKGSTGNPPAGGSVWKERVFARSNNHLGVFPGSDVALEIMLFPGPAVYPLGRFFVVQGCLGWMMHAAAQKTGQNSPHFSL